MHPLVSAETVQGIVFLQRQFGTAVDTCIASNYVKLPPPLISYRHCYPVNPFGFQSCQDEARGRQGSARVGGGGWIKIPGAKQPGTGFLWVERCKTPSPAWDPLTPQQGTGTRQGMPGCWGLAEHPPRESRVGTQVAQPRSKQWVCIAWVFGAAARGRNPGLKRSINSTTKIIWAPVNSLL